MRKQASGSTVATASRAAIEGQSLVGAYGASKAAMVSLIGTLALENEELRIAVNVVLLGRWAPLKTRAIPRVIFRSGFRRRRWRARVGFLGSAGTPNLQSTRAAAHRVNANGLRVIVSPSNVFQKGS